MKLSKTAILIQFIKFRYARLFRSNIVSNGKKRSWLKNLTLSEYYRPFMSERKGFPLMNKALFMANFDAINTVNISKKEALELALNSEKTRDFTPAINGISIGLSSGTSGSRGVFLTSKKEKEAWVAAILDRVIGFSLKKRKVAFFLRANNNLYEAVKSKLISFNFFDIKTPIANHVQSLRILNAQILIGQPSVLVAIAHHYEAQGIQPSFKKIISVAEVLEADQKDYLSSVFKQPIEQVYQCTEGFLGYTCKSGNLHLNEDWLKIEKHYLDAEKKRFHPIITDYLRSSQPVVCYELNDILHEGLTCNCGSKTTVISQIEGRSDDVFKFNVNEKEVTIYPDFIRRAVISVSDDIVNYTVVRIESRLINLAIETNLNGNDDQVFRQVVNSLLNMFLEYGITDININRTDLEHDQINKFRRVKNEYKASV